MPKFTNKKSIYYNDVNLLARRTAIDESNPLGALSRKNIPVELNRVYVSPMQAIVGMEFAQKANELGLGLCLHRFPHNGLQRNWGFPDGQARIFQSLQDTSNVFVSVGLNDFANVDTNRYTFKIKYGHLIYRVGANGNGAHFTSIGQGFVRCTTYQSQDPGCAAQHKATPADSFGDGRVAHIKPGVFS